MIARLLHGFTDRLPSLRCCGKRWNDLPRHRSFAHGEEVVIPEQEYAACTYQHPLWLTPCGQPTDGPIHTMELGLEYSGRMRHEFDQPPRRLDGSLMPDLRFPCFCGAPAVGWVYDVMSDGQTINGLAVCAAHQEEIG